MSSRSSAGALIGDTVTEINNFKTQSSQIWVFEERGNLSTRRKPLGVEKRTNKLNPHLTPDLGIVPGPHWCHHCAILAPATSSQLAEERMSGFHLTSGPPCGYTEPKKKKNSFGNFTLLLCKKMSRNLLLFCAPTWPSYYVIENHLFTHFGNSKENRLKFHMGSPPPA